MNTNNLRWTEIKFAYLCTDLYQSIHMYPTIVSYLDILSEFAGVDKMYTLRLLQKVTQVNHIKPTKTEYIQLARENKETIERIVQVLRISKKTYFKLYDKNIKTTYYPQCSVQEIEHMSKILEAHNKIRNVGI